MGVQTSLLTNQDKEDFRHRDYPGAAEYNGLVLTRPLPDT